MIKIDSLEKAKNIGKIALENLRHAVGYPEFYRNAYCCQIDSDDDFYWSVLVGLGLAKFGPLINDGRDRYYHVTRAGLEALRNTEGEK